MQQQRTDRQARHCTPTGTCGTPLICAAVLLFHCSHLQLKELKQELGQLRVAKVTGGAPNKLSKM
jgi:hypothetical protein